MKRIPHAKSGKTKSKSAMPKPMAAAAARHGTVKRASIFRNGSNQAVRLPQDMRFGEHVREVRIRKLADGLLLSPVKPDWASFFALAVDVPDDFLMDRDDRPPQSRREL
jgi:antitoxin VapB